MSYYGNFYHQPAQTFYSAAFTDGELQYLFGTYTSIEIPYKNLYTIRDSSGEKNIPHDQFYIMLQRLNNMPSVPLHIYFRLFNDICRAPYHSPNCNDSIQKNVDEILGLLLAGICQRDDPFKTLAEAADFIKRAFISNIEQQLLRFSTSKRSVFKERFQEIMVKFDKELQDRFPAFRLYCKVLLNDNANFAELFQENSSSAFIELALKLKDQKNETMEYILKKILLVNPVKLGVISRPFSELLLSNVACAEESTFKKEWLKALLDASNAASADPKIWPWIKNMEGGIHFVKEHYPLFWVKYLTIPIYCRSHVDSAYYLYLDSLEEICREHRDVFEIILKGGKCCDTMLVRNLLKAAARPSGNIIKRVIGDIFLAYGANDTLFPLVNEYFNSRSIREPLIIQRIEEEAFVERNLFRLLNSCIRMGYSSVSKDLGDLLAAKLIKRSAEGSFSSDEVKLSLPFILYHKIQNHPFILRILEQGMEEKILHVEEVKSLVEMLINNKDNSLLIINILEKAIDAKLLTAESVKFFAEIAIDYNRVSLLRKILNEYGGELGSIIDGVLSVKFKQSVNRCRIMGLLYAYKNKQLPKFFEFDFLLEAYCEHSYDIWKASNGTNQSIKLTIKADVGESSMIPGAKEEIWKTANAKFPDINPRASYLECMEYIKTELTQLEGHSRALHDPAARGCFIPDQCGGKVDPVVAKMSDAKIKIARYHTALRLLKRDENDVEYIYNEPYFAGFDETVGYCYEIAKKAGCLDAFIQALVDIRRGHNIDAKERCQTRKDYPSCAAGAPGRLYQSYVLHFNLIVEQERSRKKYVFQEFNAILVNDQIKNFVLKSLSDATRNFTGEAHHHLAWLIYHYQADLNFSGDDNSRDKAEKAIEYILENEIDYLQLYRQLAGLYVTKQIHECPAEVKKALKDMIAYQLRVIFFINKHPKSHLEGMWWETLPPDVIKNIYPAILLHFLNSDNPDSVQFNDLVTVAWMMVPAVLDEFREKLLLDLPILARFYVRKHSEAECVYFIHNMKLLLVHGVISDENIKSFFKEFFVLAAREECFGKKAIVLLECSKDIFGDALKAELKDAICKLLITVQYKQYGELRNLLQYAVENNLMSKNDLAKIMQQQAQQFITNKNHTAYLRWVRLSSRLDINIVLQDSALTRIKLAEHSATMVRYNRNEDKLLMRNIQSIITSRAGSFGSITELRKDSFKKLTQFSVQGNAYASFVMAQLYYSKQAIAINSANEAQWTESSELAIIYASIAIQQAKVMGDPCLEQEIKLFFNENLSAEEFGKLSLNGFEKLNLEELYYTYMLELLNDPKAVDFSIKLENFLLIAKSIDLGQLLPSSEFVSANKTVVETIVKGCSTGSDLSKARTLLHIYTLMEENGCYLQSNGGSFYPRDPRLMAPEILFQRRYQPVLNALRAIAADLLGSQEPIDSQSLCEKIAAEIGIHPIETVEYLKCIYQHIFNSKEYQGNTKNLGKPEHEIIGEILTQICKRSNIELNIVSISNNISGSSSSSSSASRPSISSGSISEPSSIVRSSGLSGSTSGPSSIVRSSASSSSSSSGPAVSPSNNSMGTWFMSAVRSGLNTFFTEPSESSQAIEPRHAVEPEITVDGILSALVNVDQNPNPGPILARCLAGDTPLQVADSRKKIMVVGDSSVGKSCLILRLADDIYTDSFISTIGVDFKLHTANACGQRFGLQIWDICGQERFRNVDNGVYRGVAVFVLCFDLNDRVSFCNIKKWVSEVQRYVKPETKVILVGTKCDLVDERVVAYDEAKGLADSMGIYYLEISSKDSINTNRLEALIALAPYSQRADHLDQARHYHIEGEENTQRSAYSRRG